MNTEETVVEQSTSEKANKPKKSKGQLFKEVHGYSKTMKRLMQRYHATSLEAYREIRKKNKKAKKASDLARHKK